MNISKEAAMAAAQWWGNKVHSNTVHRNGDDSPVGGMATILAGLLNEPVSEEVHDKFVDILTKKILEADRITSWDLDCDYGPSAFLAEAAKEAGISPHNFPWKTTMYILDGIDGGVEISVRDGYQAPRVTIYSEEAKKED